ncbi:2'-5' RNA ligase family protein [Hyphomonas sp. NPDC076900]|uniref:2'-5' RNA ligase family protein n=1 Tax=unclassified Hyphomonas TaxID=2630699 RepID=UPI003D0351B1
MLKGLPEIQPAQWRSSMSGASNFHPPPDVAVREHNLFFAVMAPPCAHPFLAEKSAQFRGRYAMRGAPITPDRWHISLHHIFRGPLLPPKVIESSTIIGKALRFEQFELKLGRVMSYQNHRRKKPFVVCTHQPSTHMDRLARLMGEAFIVLSGTPPRAARRISPHITLAWDRVIVPPQAIDPITIPVTEIALIHSHVGHSRYEFLGRWALVP